MTKVELSEQQASEMYYNINSYFLFLTCAQNVDKTMFGRLKFWSPTMNNHLRKARQSVEVLMQEFNKQFKAIDEDIVMYDAPAELHEAMDYLSRLTPEEISAKMKIIRNINENGDNELPR